jgi:hypothetical protein
VYKPEEKRKSAKKHIHTQVLGRGEKICLGYSGHVPNDWERKGERRGQEKKRKTVE